MELRIDVGQTVFVERRTATTTLKGVSTILGAKPPRYLLLDIPKGNGRTLTIVAGETCIVRYLRNGVMVGFRSRVVRNISDPLAIMVIQYPPNVEEVIVRQEERIRCNITASLEIEDPNKNDPQEETPAEADSATADSEAPPMKSSLTGALTDMNPMGSCFAVEVRLWEDLLAKRLLPDNTIRPETGQAYDSMMLGSNVSLVFDLPPPAIAGPRRAECSIQRVQRDGGHVFVGLRFHVSDTALIDDIDAMVKIQKEYFVPRLPSPD